MNHLKKYENLRDDPKLKGKFDIVDKKINSIKSKKMFINALRTLLFSWGGDPPPESFWAAEEFLDYYELVNNVKLIRFSNEYGDNFEEVIKSILDS